MSQKQNFNFTEELSYFETHAQKARIHLGRVTCRIKNLTARRAIVAAAHEYFLKALDMSVPVSSVNHMVNEILKTHTTKS